MQFGSNPRWWSCNSYSGTFF